jgi:hypothetical protein
MAAAPWTVRVRERAVEAERRSRQASSRLDIDARAIESHHPMQIADVPRARSNAWFVLLSLCDVGGDVAVTAATAKAAELLALRGAAADPTAPLPSVADIPEAHLRERVAVSWLRQARERAEAAYDNVGWCCERLLTACNLLEHPSLPGVDGLLDAERAAAHGYLVVAKDLTTVSYTCARAALQVLNS